MTEVGGVFIKTVQLSGGSFTTVFAPTGEQIKITMVYAKAQSDGSPANSEFFVAPASGQESGSSFGAQTKNNSLPPVGALFSDQSGTKSLLQPHYITDSDGIYIGRGPAGGPVDVILQGVRVA